MYHQLATRFGRNSHQISAREALDNEALYRHVPSVFAREAHDSRSDRYVYVPTIEIVEGLRKAFSPMARRTRFCICWCVEPGSG